MNKFQIVMSLGQPCFNALALKGLGYKKFSGPFDSMFSNSVNDIIDMMENCGFKAEELIYTQDWIGQSHEIDAIQGLGPCRTLHQRYDNFVHGVDLDLQRWNAAFLPHHNLKDSSHVDHFNRCFNRLSKIRVNKIRTLFTVFVYDHLKAYDHRGPYMTTGFLNNISDLKNFLQKTYNCHLLVVHFRSKKQKTEWDYVQHDENMTHVHINNTDFLFDTNKKSLEEIFKRFDISDEDLLSYKAIEEM